MTKNDPYYSGADGDAAKRVHDSSSWKADKEGSFIEKMKWCDNTVCLPLFWRLPLPILLLNGASGARNTYKNSTYGAYGAGGARNTSKMHEKFTKNGLTKGARIQSGSRLPSCGTCPSRGLFGQFLVKFWPIFGQFHTKSPLPRSPIYVAHLHDHQFYAVETASAPHSHIYAISAPAAPYFTTTWRLRRPKYQ